MTLTHCSLSSVKALNKEIMTESATLHLLSLNKAAEHQCLLLIID